LNFILNFELYSEQVVLRVVTVVSKAVQVWEMEVVLGKINELTVLLRKLKQEWRELNGGGGGGVGLGWVGLG
jgi:hypothetical protein